MATVDVIVVTWNDRDNALKALDSVFSLSEVQAEGQFANVVVSDNGSADDTVPALRKRYGQLLTIIENRENLGFGGGCNRAIARTAAPYIFLLNPDAVLHDGALASIVEFMKRNPRCALAGPKIFESDGTVAESCGEFDTWVGAFLRSSAWGELPLFSRFANGSALRAWDYDTMRKVDLVIGAAMVLRRSVIQQIGGFDERYFMYHEEVDLAKRVAQAGYETWFVPCSQAVHQGQGSSRGRSVEALKQRSRRQYWIKHHGYPWYAMLTIALVGRYLFYAVALIALAIAARRVFLGPAR
ncbi:MAG: glycosyltransferase family 2 protein [Candidatus Eremiobacteraeota bacterium]|nr:glycosyltransferase family 2 protein [Candidatus Eremiobacteraeota bacterium]